MRRAVLWAMVPANLFLLAWVYAGRALFGVAGWFLLILLPVVLVMAAGLIVTTVLALTQSGSPKALTHAQVFAQLVTWLGMFGFGLFLPDFGDTDDSAASVLTQLFGFTDDLIDTSFAIAAAFGVVAVVGYLPLLVLLIARRREA